MKGPRWDPELTEVTLSSALRSWRGRLPSPTGRERSHLRRHPEWPSPLVQEARVSPVEARAR